MKYISLICSFIPLLASAQVTGRIWHDVNHNGRPEAHEAMAPSVRVRVYNADGQLTGQTISTSNGSFYVSVPPGERVRIEFSGLDQGQQTTPGSTPVRFVTSPAEVNLGLYRPAQYVGPRARLVQPVYVTGNYTERSADTLSALVLTSTGPDQPILQRLATPTQVGSLWGLAYDRVHGRLFGAALAKRHSAFGPLGAGGIYRVSIDSSLVQPLVSLDRMGFPTAPTKLERDLSGSLTGVSHDSTMFSLIGKCSLGGLDVSDDGQSLFVMNLFDRKLYRIRLPTDGSAPVGSDVTTYALPTLTDRGGDVRPFAVKYYADKIYVGAVCDAAQSRRPADLKAIVFVFDPAKEEFAEVFSTRLDYPRGVLDYGVSAWQPWTDDYNRAVVANSGNWLIYPQPILADIEFDTDGSMILGLMDRLGHQTGDGQLFRPTGSAQLMPYRGLSGGDVLRAAYRNGRYELERNGRSGEQVSTGRNNRQGPTGGEFYAADGFAADGVVWHQETATGGLALLPEAGQLVVAAREPIPGQYVTGGLRWLSNQTGDFVRGLAAFPGGERVGYYWKTNNVGDVEIIPNALPSQLGNRVWLDTDQDGLQDADEPGLPGITVQLHQNGRQVAATITDGDGYYHFLNTDLPGGLRPHTVYEIRIPFRQDRYAGLHLPVSPTKRQPYRTDFPTEIDNDAVTEAEAAVIRLKTGMPGESLRGLDAGLSLPADHPREIDSRLTLTPNPTTGDVRLRYHSDQVSGSVTISVRDAAGRSVQNLKSELNGGFCNTSLDLSGLGSGKYFVVVREGTSVTTGSLIKL